VREKEGKERSAREAGRRDSERVTRHGFEDSFREAEIGTGRDIIEATGGAFKGQQTGGEGKSERVSRAS